MDITNVGFDGNLLDILEAISEAHFVALDLEFSGIADLPVANRNKQTIEQRYQQTKEAAQQYQVLQVGITCAYEDGERGKYILRTYNITLNPMISSDLEIVRRYMCESAAIDFLLSNNFDLNASYRTGVRYLSPQEERLAKLKFKERLNRTYDDIEILDDDLETIAFLDYVRRKINNWLRKKSGEGLLISARAPELDVVNSDGEAVASLTNFDKRLIHQLVRKEHPHLVSLGRSGSIFIKPLDEMKEAALRETKKRYHQKDILRHRGFCWIVRALLGQSLDDLEVRDFAKDPVTGMALVYSRSSVQARFDRIQHWLNNRRPVLVGHNVFVDLVYLYQAFVDDLPETLDEFSTAIHDYFPLIIDTKFLVTHDVKNTMPQSRLDEIWELLRQEAEPKIEMHPSHDKYNNIEHGHEAGYDSLITAKIAIILSSQLEGKSRPARKLSAPAEDGEVFGKDHQNTVDEDLAEHMKSLNTTPASSKLISKTGQRSDRLPSTSSRFAQANPFAALMNGEATSSPDSSPKRSSKKATRNAGLLMPNFENGEFWNLYGNKLRVFGTIEKVVDLGPASPSDQNDEDEIEVEW